MARKRRFGRLRKLPSGRWQARYLGRDGLDRAAPQTFATKAEADRWLSLVEAELQQGRWLDPRRGEVPLGEYAQRWVEERPGLRPRTVELYEGLLRRHLVPQLGRLPLNGIDPARVREWRTALWMRVGPR